MEPGKAPPDNSTEESKYLFIEKKHAPQNHWNATEHGPSTRVICIDPQRTMLFSMPVQS